MNSAMFALTRRLTSEQSAKYKVFLSRSLVASYTATSQILSIFTPYIHSVCCGASHRLPVQLPESRTPYTEPQAAEVSAHNTRDNQS